MMTWRRYVPLALAVVFAILSSVSVYQFLKDRSGVSHAAVANPLSVVVTKHPVEIGDRLMEDNLEAVPWTDGSAPSGSYRSTRSLAGRTAKMSFGAREPVVDSKLLAEGENLSSLIPLGMRATTVSVPYSETLASMLERGTLVDVLSLFTFESSGVASAEVIVEKARVIAVRSGDWIDAGFRGGPKQRNMEVTLIVTPEEAKWIVAAANQGIVDLIVRSE